MINTQNTKFDDYAHRSAEFVAGIIKEEGNTAGVIVNSATAMTITGLSIVGRSLAELNGVIELPPAMLSIAFTHVAMKKPLEEIERADIKECLEVFKSQIEDLLEVGEDEE